MGKGFHQRQRGGAVFFHAVIAGALDADALGIAGLFKASKKGDSFARPGQRVGAAFHAGDMAMLQTMGEAGMDSGSSLLLTIW